MARILTCFLVVFAIQDVKFNLNKIDCLSIKKKEAPQAMMTLVCILLALNYPEWSFFQGL